MVADHLVAVALAGLGKMSFEQKIEYWISNLGKDNLFLIFVASLFLFSFGLYFLMKSKWLKESQNPFLKFLYEAGHRRPTRTIDITRSVSSSHSTSSHTHSSGFSGGGGEFGGGGASGSW